MSDFTFRQLGTQNTITTAAEDKESAKKIAAERLRCRFSSCLYVSPDGMVDLYTLKNVTSKQRHKIKADDIDSARAEMAAATDSKAEDWIFRAKERRKESMVSDIEYLSFESNFSTYNRMS